MYFLLYPKERKAGARRIGIELGKREEFGKGSRRRGKRGKESTYDSSQVARSCKEGKWRK